MAASAGTDQLQTTEDAILATVSQEGGDASAADVIRSVSATQPPAVVREAYWQLISENRLIRSADGRLSRSQ
jgi:hypothetical protein